MQKKDPEPLLALQRAVTAFNNAETLFFDGRKLHTSGLIQEAYREAKLPVPVTRQRYYSRNCAATNYLRVESAIDFEGKDLTTVFIKNSDGIWDVYPTLACEVSAIFKRDQLMGTFPFFRFFSSVEYPYELSIDESSGKTDQFIVKGRLAAKPAQCEEDIAKDFAYTISRTNGNLCSLREMTFANRPLHLILDSLEINRPIDPRLFELCDRKKITVSNMEEYMNIRMKEWGSISLQTN